MVVDETTRLISGLCRLSLLKLARPLLCAASVMVDRAGGSWSHGIAAVRCHELGLGSCARVSLTVEGRITLRGTSPRSLSGGFVAPCCERISFLHSALRVPYATSPHAPSRQVASTKTAPLRTPHPPASMSPWTVAISVAATLHRADLIGHSPSFPFATTTPFLTRSKAAASVDLHAPAVASRCPLRHRPSRPAPRRHGMVRPRAHTHLPSHFAGVCAFVPSFRSGPQQIAKCAISEGFMNRFRSFNATARAVESGFLAVHRPLGALNHRSPRAPELPPRHRNGRREILSWPPNWISNSLRYPSSGSSVRSSHRYRRHRSSGPGNVRHFQS
jgi:hypothetical protein